MSVADGLIDANIRALDGSAGLITRLDDALYRRTIGAQVRHTLDFYGCLLDGLVSGRVDYAARARVPLLETSRAAACERHQTIAGALAALEPSATARRILVRAESTGPADDESLWSPSSVRRELEFLLSHTVHHQALMAEMLRAGGIDPGSDLGVAPSTLRHRSRLALAS
jgi:hypothetical protein